MVFSSLIFLFRFLPLVLVLYFILPKRCKNAVLLITSLLFYAWGEPVCVMVMILSTIVGYTHGRIIHHFKEKEKIFFAKIFMISSIIINLSLLGFFKYSNFILQTINGIFNSSFSLLKIALPIGISFYTFQTMSYCIDVYRGSTKVQKNFISYGAYITMFSQLIAGPIVQYKDIETEIDERKETFEGFSKGASIFIIGLAKKVLLANNIGYLWTQIESTPFDALPVVTAWLGMLAFTIQIYFDFSGYSDMAVGLGHIFGFHFPNNFDYPYLSKSVTEFWRRWHITLGTWFREYVYIPLGGNKKGLLKQLRNILIVWALTGFWHGASFNFLLWGLYYGILLVLEKTFLLKYIKKLPAFLSTAYAFLLACFGWVIFSITDTASIPSYFKALFGMAGNGIYNTESLYYLYNYGIVFLISFIGCSRLPLKAAGWLQKKLSSLPVLFEIIKALFLLLVFTACIAFLVNASYNPFLYFRF